MGPRCVPRNGASGTRTRNREGEGTWIITRIRLQVMVRTSSFCRLYIRCTYTLARIQADRRDCTRRSRMGHLVHARMHTRARVTWAKHVEEEKEKRNHKEGKTDRTIRPSNLRDSAGSSLTASTRSLLRLRPASFAFIVKSRNGITLRCDGIVAEMYLLETKISTLIADWTLIDISLTVWIFQRHINN